MDNPESKDLNFKQDNQSEESEESVEISEYSNNTYCNLKYEDEITYIIHRFSQFVKKDLLS